MSNARRRGAVTCGLAVLLSAVPSTLASAATKTGTAAMAVAARATTLYSEAAAVRLARWTSNVTVSHADGSWTFTSDGIPASNFVASDYAVPANPFDVSAAGASVHASASILQDQHYDYTLPLTPRYAKTVTRTNQGPIGIMLDGAALYNPYEANHSTIATADNFVATQDGVTASFLDDCDGHPGPGGQYHYHGLPECLVAYATGASPVVQSVTSTSGATTTAVDEDNAASKKPVILGFAFDGYGIYDNVAMNGKTVPVSALDACNGIVSPVPGYPHGVYHYVLENVKGVRSSIGCYHGVVSSAYTQALEIDLSGAGATSTAPAVDKGPATAISLAANKSEDHLLRALLALSPWRGEC
jgi:YHYH protein